MPIYSEYIVCGHGDDCIIVNEQDIDNPGFVDEFMKYEGEFRDYPCIIVDKDGEYTCLSLLEFAEKYLDKNGKSKLFDVLNGYLEEQSRKIQFLKHQ